jgi:RNA polymerase-associated protein CTR9
MTVIEIPIKNTDEVVEVDLADLPEVSEIISILQEEESPRDLYYKFAVN